MFHRRGGRPTAGGDRLAAPCTSIFNQGCKAELTELNAVSFYRDHHPVSHTWPLNLVASGILLLLTALLVLSALRLLRRRTA
ncbi:hypothetical protein GCM10009601_17390 [Streptomyces thermospinosisporus]|uniref:ABC transporter permease n=1 Tax=Streptomyces thermospinosisporus TaxID=161482 RepID=A0ABN1YRU6_9ACTN